MAQCYPNHFGEVSTEFVDLIAPSLYASLLPCLPNTMQSCIEHRHVLAANNAANQVCSWGMTSLKLDLLLACSQSTALYWHFCSLLQCTCSYQHANNTPYIVRLAQVPQMQPTEMPGRHKQSCQLDMLMVTPCSHGTPINVSVMAPGIIHVCCDVPLQK